MSFVFVSHASLDKPLLRHVVDALLAADLKLWVDNPADLGFSGAEIERYFHRIHVGRPWDQEIDDAQVAAGCVLVCWSERATTAKARKLEERYVLFEEAAFARKAGKLVACTIDGVNPLDLPGDNSRQHSVAVGLNVPEALRSARLATLVADIRAKMHAVALGQVRTPRRNSFKPFLADRALQETAIETALDQIDARGGGVRPFVIAGPENECPDKLVQRLTAMSARRLGGSAWEAITVKDWPDQTEPDLFHAAYRSRLWSALQLKGQMTDRLLADALEAKERPIALLHQLPANAWTRSDPKRLRAWADYWAAFARTAPRARVLPIFSIHMKATEPGWKHCPRGSSGGRVSHRDIWKAVCALEKRLKKIGGDDALQFPPVLGPIENKHALDWLNGGYLDADETSRATSRIKTLFANRRHARHGMNHQTFASEIDDAIAN